LGVAGWDAFVDVIVSTGRQLRKSFNVIAERIEDGAIRRLSN
jgi:hypothetical protein